VKHTGGKKYFTTLDIVLVSIFCALWATLNLTLGRLGFIWFGLPIFCDFAAYFTLLLVTWATGKFGTASMVGVIGSTITLLIGGLPHIVGFAASAILFDILMSANNHNLSAKAYNMTLAALVTMVSAYFAGSGHRRRLYEQAIRVGNCRMGINLLGWMAFNRWNNKHINNFANHCHSRKNECEED